MGVSLISVGLVTGAAGSASPDDDRVLHFVREGSPVRSLDVDALRSACGVTRVEVEDPYHGRTKVFAACPLGEVLTLGFGNPIQSEGNANFFLRARDGYTQAASGARLSEKGAHLAFADLSNPAGENAGWEPIDRRQVDPGPFYLVWNGPGQNDIHRYPWPYQLATIERAPFEREYPHTLPRGEPPDAAAWSGFALFREQCISCHAVNGEGGRVGPDLNVPQSIVDYRPAAQIKAFIREPQRFRYTSMPSHRHLSEPQLDALIAYFEAMSARKRDPGPTAGGH